MPSLGDVLGAPCARDPPHQLARRTHGCSACPPSSALPRCTCPLSTRHRSPTIYSPRSVNYGRVSAHLGPGIAIPAPLRLAEALGLFARSSPWYRRPRRARALGASSVINSRASCARPRIEGRLRFSASRPRPRLRDSPLARASSLFPIPAHVRPVRQLASPALARAIAAAYRSSPAPIRFPVNFRFLRPFIYLPCPGPNEIIGRERRLHGGLAVIIRAFDTQRRENNIPDRLGCMRARMRQARARAAKLGVAPVRRYGLCPAGTSALDGPRASARGR